MRCADDLRPHQDRGFHPCSVFNPISPGFQVEAGCTPDFILAMGDEESDEMMFEAVKDFSRGVMGEAPTTPDTVPTSGQGGPTSPRRRSYQV